MTRSEPPGCQEYASPLLICLFVHIHDCIDIRLMYAPYWERKGHQHQHCSLCNLIPIQCVPSDSMERNVRRSEFMVDFCFVSIRGLFDTFVLLGILDCKQWNFARKENLAIKTIFQAHNDLKAILRGFGSSWTISVDCKVHQQSLSA